MQIWNPLLTYIFSPLCSVLASRSSQHLHRPSLCLFLLINVFPSHSIFATHLFCTLWAWFTDGGSDGGGVALRKSASHVRVHVHVGFLKVAVAVANAIKTNAKNPTKMLKTTTALVVLKFMCWWAANLSWQLRMPAAETLSKPWCSLRSPVGRAFLGRSVLQRGRSKFIIIDCLRAYLKFEISLFVRVNEFGMLFIFVFIFHSINILKARKVGGINGIFL